MRPGLRWAAIPIVGVAIALWSVATVAGLHSVGTSLTAASNSLPQNLLAPRTIALADPQRTLPNSWTNSWAPLASRQRQASLLSRCDAGCAQAAASFVHEGKVARLKPSAKSNIVPVVAEISAQARFDRVVAKAALSPQKLAAAFARASGAAAPFAVASLPTAARSAEPVRLPDQDGPASVRFGPEVAEIERSFRLALALANALPEEMIDVLPEVTTADPAAPQEGEVQLASLPPQDEMPDSVPLPTFRPHAEIDQSDEAPEVEAPKVKAPKVQASKAAKAQSQPSKANKEQTADAPQVETPRAPALSPRSSSPAAIPSMQSSQGMQGSPGMQGSQGKPKAADMLAYAKPDSPAGGGVFRNLFTKPSMGSGVAVYDISAKTVYMPDGSRLEAHSGLGSMADQPRYANRKNAGPTPPHTYDLRLRESRFHGVEALRLTPIDGKNKFGRDGFLAHTYLLRGGRAESSGCVAFKDYARFLAAFKKGKIKRLVVRG
ncbi:tlde1 domain-containing protein [Mesorhizobium delmotii]|nr:tlde1 domain-containing protein [Mesorhizobium delmotii]